MAAGGSGIAIDDFHANWAFDRGPLGYIGGSTIAVSGTGGRPIGHRPVPPGTPLWGSEWKRATAKWYQASIGVGALSSVMPNRENYLDLDPTYRNRFGQPLLRMTFDFKANEQKMMRHAVELCAQLGKAMNPTIMPPSRAQTSWSVGPYQSTHNTGGAIMGTEPGASAVNTWLQSWDVTNV